MHSWSTGIIYPFVSQRCLPQLLVTGKSSARKHRSWSFQECICFPVVDKHKRTKFGARSTAAIFVGYDVERRAYLCYNVDNRKLFSSRSVDFNEKESGAKLLSSGYDDNWYIGLIRDTYDTYDSDDSSCTDNNSVENSPSLPGTSATSDTPADGDVKAKTKSRGRKRKTKPRVKKKIDHVAEAKLRLEQGARVSKRLLGLSPDAEWDDVADGSGESDNSDACNVDVCEPVVNKSVPTCYSEAIRGDEAEAWKEAMQQEINSLESLTVWKVVTPPRGVKVVPSKWVYSKKYNIDGSLHKYKARLVAVGNRQRPGIDYFESYSPVVRSESVKLLLSIAARNRYSVRVFDISSAYVNSDLDIVTYMKQPAGFQKGQEGDVCCLKKALYGLPQAGRCWYLRLVEILTSSGLVQSTIDPCVFYCWEEGNLLGLCSHVDDLLTIGRNDSIDRLIARISNYVKILETSSGLYLGLGWRVMKWGIVVFQEAYVQKLLKRFGMESCKPVATPADPNQVLDQCENSPECNRTEFQEMLGSVMYLVYGTRSDLAHAVTNLARFAQNPKMVHLQALKRVIRYLSATRDYGLVFPYGGKEGLTVQSDASWSVTNDAKGFTGYVVKFSGCAIAWKCQKQQLSAYSSAESELIALSEAVREVRWTWGLLGELQPRVVEYPVIVETDSQSVIDMVNNLGIGARSKHYARKLWTVRDQVKLGNVKLCYKESRSLAADMLTKPVTREVLKRHLPYFNLLAKDRWSVDRYHALPIHEYPRSGGACDSEGPR